MPEFVQNRLIATTRGGPPRQLGRRLVAGCGVHTWKRGVWTRLGLDTQMALKLSFAPGLRDRPGADLEVEPLFAKRLLDLLSQCDLGVWGLGQCPRVTAVD